MTQSNKALDITSLKTENIKYVLCDIDDTLTNKGKLLSSPYTSLWKLNDAGISVIPITGRPAGWCEMIARLWPVKGIVGENGAFYFSYENNKMNRSFSQSIGTREENSKKIENLKEIFLNEVPGCDLASDQFCRVVDLAIDFCEDVKPLPQSSINKIVEIFKSHGAHAKVSSIHVNGWFGDHDKLTTSLNFLNEVCSLTSESEIQENCVFIGDSPNDEPMFKYFKNSVGVANIKDYLDQLQDRPTFMCKAEGGHGFVELTNHILA